MASLFILAGISKIMGPAAVNSMLLAGGFTLTAFFLSATIALEVGFCLMVATGGRIAVPACLGLASFTPAASVMFHAFWQLEGKMARTEISLFLKNITISAALIYIAGVEAGRGKLG